MVGWRHLGTVSLAVALLVPGAAAIAQPAAGFDQLCREAGVIACIGFDRSDDVRPGRDLFSAGDGRFLGSLDSTIKASGASSLRFEIPSNSGQNSSGYWIHDLSPGFGEGSRLYVRWKQRFSRSMVETRFGGGGWKQIILHPDGPSCAAVQVVLQNVHQRGLPQGYSNCGKDNFNVRLPDGDSLIQQGDYPCMRRSQREGDCARYVADQWMTFYLEVDIGQLGEPTSSIRGFVSYEGQRRKKFIDQENWVFRRGKPKADRLTKVQLTPYNTGKDPGLAHPVAYTWYDELIVSRSPIPDTAD